MLQLVIGLKKKQSSVGHVEDNRSTFLEHRSEKRLTTKYLLPHRDDWVLSHFIDFLPSNEELLEHLGHQQQCTDQKMMN